MNDELKEAAKKAGKGRSNAPKVESDDIPYTASKPHVEKLWKDFGVEAVKAVPGFRKMTIAQLRAVLGKK